MTKMTKKNKVYCDKEVKDVFKQYSHMKCTCKNRRMYATQVTGSRLNKYLNDNRRTNVTPRMFVSNKRYWICSNLNDILHNSYAKSPSITATNSVCTQKKKTNTTAKKSRKITPPLQDGTPPSRAQRLLLRNRIPIDDPNLPGIKKVTLSFVGDEEEKENYEIDMRKIRMGKKTKFKKDVLDEYYRIPFCNLTMRYRRIRMSEVAKIILAGCIDRSAFRNDPDTYLRKNAKLGVELMNLIDGVKEYLGKKLQLNLDDLQEEVITPVENDNDGIIAELDKNKKEHKVAIALLGETSRNGYERMRESMDDFLNLPSFHLLTKNRPTVVPLQVPILKPFDVVDDGSLVMDDPLMFSMPLITDGEDELDVALRTISQPTDTMDGAVLDGGYERFIELIENKHEKKGRIIEGNENVAVLDSIDGAEHHRSNNTVTSVISFSSSILSPHWINSREITAGSSLNVLTWQQLRGSESILTMKPAVEDYFNSKKILRDSLDDKRKKYFYYDLHDGKMLYLLTQHSQWNRKHHPFILCTCKRGVGVTNNDNHVCHKISGEEQIHLYNRSQRRWDGKRNEKPSYSVKEHMDWVDEKNKGSSHFGIHPELLPRDSLRFDTFHMKCSVTRKIMNYLRVFLLQQSSEVIDDFIFKVLRKFWKDFHLFVWKNKKKFSCFQGNELALFVGATNDIIKFLQDTLVSTQEVEDIIMGLSHWMKIFKFLGITHLSTDDRRQKYLNEDILQFNENVRKFYSAGSRTFLSKKGSSSGTEETFYMHALRYYMPDIALVTFERHQVGVGIFSMQGFERRNKESKNCMKRFCNHRGNIVATNLRRVWDIFEHDINAF